MDGSEAAASAVFHFTPPHVLCLPQYQQWMQKFPSSTTHLTINSDNSCQGTIAVHRLQHKLHLLHKDIFPLLKERPKVAPTGTAVHGNTLVKFHMRPNIGIDL
jgi:ribonuclease Z